MKHTISIGNWSLILKTQVIFFKKSIYYKINTVFLWQIRTEQYDWESGYWGQCLQHINLNSCLIREPNLQHWPAGMSNISDLRCLFLRTCIKNIRKNTHEKHIYKNLYGNESKTKMKRINAFCSLQIRIKIPNSSVKCNTEIESGTAECFIMKYNNSPKHSFLFFT